FRTNPLAAERLWMCRVQNRASLAVPLSATQKLTPSLAAPNAATSVPNGKDPIGVRSAAFQREALSPKLVTRTLSPSKALAIGATRPLPVSVWRSAPVEALITAADGAPLFRGTQMFTPSKTGKVGPGPTVTV